MSIATVAFLIAVAFCMGHAVGAWREANGKRKPSALSASAEQAARQRGSTARSESDRDIDRRNKNYLTADEIHAAKKAAYRG